MAERIDPPVLRLLQGQNYCHVGTVRKDGSLHVVPVWVDTDGEHVVLNSAEGRIWVRNLEREPRVTCTVMNMENPYEFAEIRGRVAERTQDGADAHIDRMAKKYLGHDSYPFRQPGEQRVIFRIAAERIFHNSPQG